MKRKDHIVSCPFSFEYLFIKKFSANIACIFICVYLSTGRSYFYGDDCMDDKIKAIRNNPLAKKYFTGNC